MDAEPTSLAVLFAQISGSASLYESLGDSRGADAVGGAHAGLRAAVEKHAGTVVKTVGDELIARFPDADGALQAATAMQAVMRAQPDGLALKVGFTVGPVIQEKEDVFGDTVNLAARIAALANPKQILTTRQAVDRLSPFLRSTCRSLYTTTVRGKKEQIAVFEALWQQDKSTTVVGDFGGQEPPAPVQLTLSYQGKTWDLDEEHQAVTAGRDIACDITVEGDKVSRSHARIFLRQGKFVVADQSANGTYVRMQHRAEIELHREEFVLLGSGSIGLGQGVEEVGGHAIAFQVG